MIVRKSYRIKAADCSLLSITPSCVNRGNLIIEEATREVLGVQTFAVEANAHVPLTDEDLRRIDCTTALILPGATLIHDGDHVALDQLSDVHVPLVGMGVAFRNLQREPISYRIADQLMQPIGARDPFTHHALLANGYKSMLVGCQTLLSQRVNEWVHREGPIVFSLGLGPQQALHECLMACIEVSPTKLLLHAPSKQPAPFRHPRLLACDLDTAAFARNTIATASMLVTSRIHSLLLAVTTGTPTLFLGGWYDSRYSLLEYLGCPVVPPEGCNVQRLVAKILNGDMPDGQVLERAEQMRQNFRGWMEEVFV